jgi:hypothetical protein
LKDHFNGHFNKARIKLITMFILSLVKVQTVNFNRLAVSFDSRSQSDSSLRHIQRFFASFVVDIDLLSKMLFALIPPARRCVSLRRFLHGILPHLYKGLIAETIEVKKSI